jgi:hypothetical protein
LQQLVLQFPANSVRDYDDLVALEQQLAAELGENAVDGHDMGSGEANIFILASDAQHAFRRLVLIDDRLVRKSVAAIYRDLVA